MIYIFASLTIVTVQIVGRILDMAFSSVNGTAKCVSSNTREMPYVNVKQCFRAIFNIREMEFVSFVT